MHAFAPFNEWLTLIKDRRINVDNKYMHLCALSYKWIALIKDQQGFFNDQRINMDIMDKWINLWISIIIVIYRGSK